MTEVRQRTEAEAGPYREWKDNRTNKGRCGFCTRFLYWDNWHYYIDRDNNEKKVPHDRKLAEYKEGIVNAHWDHCLAIHGSDKDKEDCAEKRKELGFPLYNKYYPDPNAPKEIVGQPIGPAMKSKEGEDINVVSQEDFDKLNDAVKTLEVRFEVLTASFNDYVNLTAKAIQGFLNDVHNNMSNKERIEARAEDLVDSTKKVVIDASYSHSYDKMDDEDKRKLDKYFKEAG